MIVLKKYYILSIPCGIRGLISEIKEFRCIRFGSKKEVKRYIKTKIIVKLEELELPMHIIDGINFRIEKRYKLVDNIFNR